MPRRTPLLGACAILSAASWYAIPFSTRAESASRVSADDVAARGDIADRIIQAVGASRGVISISAEENHPYAEILLWLHDDSDPGFINESELLLISYSRVLGAISTYRTVGTAKNDPRVSMGHESPRAFLDRWRSNATVTTGTLCRDVSDFLIHVEDTDAPEAVIVEIGLIWGEDSADPEESRSVRCNRVAPSKTMKEPVL